MRPPPEILEAYGDHPEFLGLKITDIDQRGALDNTLLHLAAYRGSVDHVRILVALGADVNARGDLGLTALHNAAMSGQKETVELLLSLGADSSIRDEHGETALDWAVDHPDVTALLRASAGGA